MVKIFKLIKGLIKDGYYKKIIYENEYNCHSKWGSEIKSYIKIEKIYSLIEKQIYYIVNVPNVSYTSRNLIKALYKTMEHESIGMSKYNSIKEKIYYSINTDKIIKLIEEGGDLRDYGKD